MKIMRLLIVLIAALLCNDVSAADFDTRYVARVGDFNGDGLKDIYLSYQPKIVTIGLDDLQIPIPTSRRMIGDFVLQQAAGGKFSAISQINDSQRRTMTQWAKATALDVMLGDFNLDGNEDAIIVNVAAVIPNALDAIVFAPASTGSAPMFVRAIDANFLKFVRDAIGWAADPAHFYDNAVRQESRTVPVQVNVYDCGGISPANFISGDPTELEAQRYCRFVGSYMVNYNVPVQVFDSVNYSVAALEFNSYLAPYKNNQTGILGSDLIGMQRILSGLFGVQFLTTNLTGPIPADVVVTPTAPILPELIPYIRFILTAARVGSVVAGILTPSPILSDEELGKMSEDWRREGEAAASMRNPGRLTFYHGTSVDRAVNILSQGLNATMYLQSRNIVDDVSGFYLTPDFDAALDFATRVAGKLHQSDYAVLRCLMTPTAHTNLIAVGAGYRMHVATTPFGKPFFELIIPLSAFPVFNTLRGAGQIQLDAVVDP